MREYIDRDAVLHHISDLPVWRDENDEACYDVDDVAISIRDFPAADVVQVVRCKDCKHWHDSAGWCDKLSFFELDGEPCSPAESQSWKMFEDDDFCSYGKRKEVQE